ncbi:MAG: phosphatidylglycerol lysyltransferase domain-containing protein [Ruminococcus sp.]
MVKQGKIIVLDGLDGCGKSTQFEALGKLLTEQGKTVKSISFPMYDKPSAALVKMYLHGDFSDTPGGVNAYAASSFYAVDRYANYKLDWEKNYAAGEIILASRYTTSNAIHQMSKLPPEQWDDYLRWLEDYEYNKLELPRPDLVLFLSLPLALSQKLLSKRYDGDAAKGHPRGRPRLSGTVQPCRRICRGKARLAVCGSFRRRTPLPHRADSGQPISAYTGGFGMLNFRKITLADRSWIQEALKQSDFMGCEYSFANNLAWCRAADSQICQYENFYLTCSFDTEDGAPHFSYPCGSGDLRKAILAMADFAAERQKPLVIFGLTSQTLPEIQALFPGVFTLENNRDDAIISTAPPISWRSPGKSITKAKPHRPVFQIRGCFFEITPNDFDECITFAAESNAKGGYSDASSVAEQYAIHTFFQNFEALELKGGLLRVDGELAAFSIGEPICSNTFGVHIERRTPVFTGHIRQWRRRLRRILPWTTPI